MAQPSREARRRVVGHCLLDAGCSLEPRAQKGMVRLEWEKVTQILALCSLSMLGRAPLGAVGGKPWPWLLRREGVEG